MTDRFVLSPRQTRTALDVLTGFVLLSVAIALAGLTWRLAGHAGTGAVMVPGGMRPVAPAANVAPVLALSPFGKAAITDGGQPTTIAAVLQGVFFARPETLSSAIVKIGDEAASNLRIGDAMGGATITAILRDRVIVNNGGRTEYLALPDPFTQPEPPGEAVPTGQNAGPPAMAQPAAAASAPAQTMTPAAEAVIARLGATPVAGGYRIGNGSLPGLRQGDVIQSMNGTALNTPDAANAAMSGAAASGTALLQILRDGKTVTVTVPLR